MCQILNNDFIYCIIFRPKVTVNSPQNLSNFSPQLTLNSHSNSYSVKICYLLCHISFTGNIFYAILTKERQKHTIKIVRKEWYCVLILFDSLSAVMSNKCQNKINKNKLRYISTNKSTNMLKHYKIIYNAPNFSNK